MPLVSCPDCDREISDAAPACIHCGRPMGAGAGTPPASPAPGGPGELERLREAATEQLRTGWGKARELATAAGEAAPGALDWVRGFGQKVAGRTPSISGLGDLVFTDCAVPAYLLPIGPGPGDFVAAFDFHDALESLNCGVLVRPRIVAWAARADVDRSRLGVVLADEFGRQFNAQRAAAQEALSSQKAERITALEVATETADSRTQVGAKAVATGVVAMLLVTNPLLDLAFLALALFGGSEVFKNLWNRVRSSGDLKKAESELREERKALEKELNRGNARFRAAVERIEVRVHPTLHDIATQMCEVEGRPPPPVGGIEKHRADAPPVAARLRESAYRERVPTWLRPILE